MEYLIPVLVGTVTPLIVEVIKEYTNMQGDNAKTVAAIVVSVVIGILTSYTTGVLGGTVDIVTTIGIVFAMSHAAYKLHYQNK